MRLITTAVALLILPAGAQAITQQAAPPGGYRLPGIAEPKPTRLPGVVEVHIGASDPVVSHELREAREQIEWRRESGEITRREARRLRREVRLVERLAYHYGLDGLDGTERRELEMRATVLSARTATPGLQQTSRRR